MDQLPVELVYYFLERAPTPDVLSFALTSSSYKPVADLVLRKRYETTYGVPVSEGRSAVDQYRLVGAVGTVQKRLLSGKMAMLRRDVAVARGIADAFLRSVLAGDVRSFAPSVPRLDSDDSSGLSRSSGHADDFEGDVGMDDGSGRLTSDLVLDSVYVDYESDKVICSVNLERDEGVTVDDPAWVLRLLDRFGPGWKRAVKLARSSRDVLAFAPGLYRSLRETEVVHVIGIQFGSEGQTVLVVRLTNRKASVDTDDLVPFP